MAESKRVALDEVLTHFQDLDDPRSTINRLHPLPSVLVIALLAVLAGAGGPTAIARWATCKEELLLAVLPLPNGIPGKDVFRRVLMTIQPEVFRACFATWLQSLRDEAAAATGIERPTLAIDGKTLRRGHDQKNGLGALHSVSVWASEFGLSLGQVACEERSNEITAIPELLRLVDVRGGVVSIDAMGCQKAIARAITQAGGDYVLGLKGNQGQLHEAVQVHVLEHREDDFARVVAGRCQGEEVGHGRRESRSYFQLEAPKGLPGFASWPGLKSIGVAVSEVERDGKTVSEVRYFLSSLAVEVTAARLARAVRSHWGIENGCHWTLDVTFGEDQSRIRDEQARENVAWLNRFGLSLLKQMPGRDSVAMRRRACGWSDDYLMQVVCGSTS